MQKWEIKITTKNAEIRNEIAEMRYKINHQECRNEN